ncbi:class I SAM-dependent methyltransferase [Candidatus Entotheonella palauensis]|uniref:Methyltransferase domain-containing protein n=1 Tax=Candidatus Entotheonella gemina TaxID=1429439 RepID=W4M9F2_9BACT|nr:class I SAM-dependent methyltransferase [Candidatus Entotheonella palauensis]ETX07004.1 MAG: hypothetical protein ETSY2_13745 [Candidatus Entotheonella gemina]
MPRKQPTQPSEFPDMQATAHERWERIADWWDDTIGDGNPTQDELVEPNQMELLDLEPGERVLEVACGAGRFARRMAAQGAEVIAFDQSANFIARARKRAQGAPGSMTFHVVNAIDEDAVLNFGEGTFDAVVCTMAIMDMPQIEPMAAWISKMLKSHGRFVFSVVHPAFNSGHATLVAERNLGDGTLKYSVRADNYLDVKVTEAKGIVDQPTKHFYFERPISMLLNTFFARGLVMDRMIETGFEPREEPDYRLNWLNLQGIPQVMIARLRKP